MNLTPKTLPAIGGVDHSIYNPNDQSLTVYYASGRVSTFQGVSWQEVVAIMQANTATIATSATPRAELEANVIGKRLEGSAQLQ